ncbi:MAG: OsmC family protein [Mailhella sp.]|nr:OsmC family protein [Mailhella sp.]
MSGIVEYEQTPAGFTVRTGHPLLGDIHVDLQSVGPDYRKGTAQAFLVSAALNCLCGTLSVALLARGVEYRRIHATGKAVKEEKGGISYVTGIDLDISVEVDDEDADVLAHCLKIVKGCMITRSIMEGVDVNVTLRPV